MTRYQATGRWSIPNADLERFVLRDPHDLHLEVIDGE